MKNIISISTGLVYKFTSDRNKMIEMLRVYGPEGIEISFADPELLFDFKITDENVRYLKGLSYVSLHAPWKNIRYGKNSISIKTLQALKKLYVEVEAKNITIEPAEIDDYAIFNDYPLKFSTENADYRKSFKYPSEIKEVLLENSKFGLTFDFAHALTVDPDPINDFLDCDRLQQIHLSYFSRELSDHSFLYKYSSEKIIDQIKKIPEDIPLVLECVAEKEEQINCIAKEIEFLRGIQ